MTFERLTVTYNIFNKERFLEAYILHAFSTLYQHSTFSLIPYYFQRALFSNLTIILSQRPISSNITHVILIVFPISDLSSILITWLTHQHTFSTSITWLLNTIYVCLPRRFINAALLVLLFYTGFSVRTCFTILTFIPHKCLTFIQNKSGIETFGLLYMSSCCSILSRFHTLHYLLLCSHYGMHTEWGLWHGSSSSKGNPLVISWLFNARVTNYFHSLMDFL